MARFFSILLSVALVSTTLAIADRAEACYVSEEDLARFAVQDLMRKLERTKQVTQISVTLDESETSGIAHVNFKGYEPGLRLRLAKPDRTWLISSQL